VSGVYLCPSSIRVQVFPFLVVATPRCDIRTIQELLGHSDVRTTMIYTHTIRSQTIKEVKSPLDF